MSIPEIEKCSLCHAPRESLWAPVWYQPKLETIRRGNWMELLACTVCGVKWLRVPWEPYASFPYMVRWDRSVEDWETLHKIDDGLTLHKWHQAMIVELFGTLDQAGAEAVRGHKHRSYGRGPLEQENVSLPDLDVLLEIK
jgi:hypothetical protein